VSLGGAQVVPILAVFEANHQRHLMDTVQQQWLRRVPLQVVHAMILKGEGINPHKITQHEAQIHTWERTNTKFFFGLFIEIPVHPV
jgi:hypothetical protein